MLNRVIKRDDHGFTLEADPRHAEIVVRDIGLVGAKASKLPGSKEEHRRAGGGPSGAGVYPALPATSLCTAELRSGKGRGPVLSATEAQGVHPVDASPQRGTRPGGVLGDRKNTAAILGIAPLGDGDPSAGLPGVVGGCSTSIASPSQQPQEDEGHTHDEVVMAAEVEEEIDEQLLEKAEATIFRGVAARLNYMGPDRPDMQYAIKEAARCMALPRQCDWKLLKKIGRYLIHRPRLVLRYGWQTRPSSLDGYTDSDWGGCTKSRKSTSGAVMMVGGHVIKSYSKQQKVLALSSAEAETYGMVACSAEILGIQACAVDLGMKLEGVVYADASAALGIVQRRGVGKVRHIRTQSLWLQEAHATKRLGYEKIDGARNPSDLMTKHLADTLQQRHLEFMNAHAASGRAETAPMLNSVDEDRYLLGTIHVGSKKSILKKIVAVEGYEMDSRDALERQRRPELACSAIRRRRVMFSPLVSQHSITPYSEVYSRHPREFVFDALGRHVVGIPTVPAPHRREAKVEEPVIGPPSLMPLSELTLSDRRSPEEEFESTVGSSGGADSQAVSLVHDTIREGPAEIDMCVSISARAQALGAPVSAALFPPRRL